MIDLRDPDLSLVAFLPDSIAGDAEIIALSHAIDPELRDVVAAIKEAIIWPRIDEQPEWVLDILAWDMRLAELAIWDTASLIAKRNILRNIFAIRKRSGTRYAVRRIFDLLDLTATIIEWWEEGALPFTYRVRVDASTYGVTLTTLQQINPLVRRFAPARARMTELDVIAERGGSIQIYPSLQIGHLIEIGFGGP